MSTGSTRGRATLVTALAQFAAPLASALIGVYIARRYRVGPATDAFFFANAVYGVALFVGQSLRTTSVASLMVDGRLDRGRLGLHLRAVFLMCAGTACLFAILALLVAPLLLSRAALGTGQVCLLLLWPAAVLQLLGGLLAAALATCDEFIAIARAYVCAAVVTTAAAVGLGSVLAIEAIPVALVLGASFSTAMMASSTLALLGRNRSRQGVVSCVSGVGARARRLWGTFGGLLLGALAMVAPQLVLSVTVAFAGHEGPGAATVMAYAQMALVMLSSLIASPVITVYAPVVAREHRHDLASLMDLSDRAFSAGVVMTPVAVAAACLIGPPIATQLFTRMTHQDISELFRVLLIISPNLLLTQALVIPMLAVITGGRFAARASATLAVAALHVLLCLVAIEVAPRTLVVLAAVSVVSTVGLTLVDYRLAFGGSMREAVLRAVRVARGVPVAGVVIYGVASLAIAPAGRLSAGTLTFLAATVVYLAWLRVGYRDQLMDIVHSMFPRGA